MATDNEEVLGELYAWDATIDDMYERGVDHADFDEDEALEAYEEMIQVGGAPAETYNDAVLSLAAQLLTKHFYKFPHVHMNVVDVLLGLCSDNRAQAVRIHTVRSLLQIVKSATSTTPPLVRACRDRIADRVAALVKSEGSNVIVRHLTQLQETLEAVDIELKKTEKRDKSTKNDANPARDDRRSTRNSEDDRRQREERDREDRRREQEQRDEEAKRERREARFSAPAKTSEPERREPVIESSSKRRDSQQSESTTDNREQKRRDSYRDDRDNGDRGQRQNERATDAAPRDRDENPRDRRQGSGKESGNGCPPSSFIFIGGVPRSTYHDDIINYLSCIDESVTHSCVQIKFPNANPNAAGYAFVSLESVDHARKAIRHIKTTEFNGRNLIGDFARGPPCSTLQFVERNGSLGMHDVDAVMPVDVDKIDRDVWDELCASLKQFGSMEILRDGRIRFRDTESAKSVIRKHRFFVAGREFLPVYDPEEQAEIDSSRRRRRSDDKGDGQRNGDLGRYGRSDVDRRDSRDDGDRKRRRSPSFDRDQRDKAPRRDQYEDSGDRHHNPIRREFDQARYGPRDSPSSFKHRDDKYGDEKSSNRRDRRSPDRESQMDRRGREGERRASHVGSGRSPTRQESMSNRPSASHRGRSRSRSSTKKFSDGGNMGKVDDVHRSRSPAKSFSSSKHGRGDMDRLRDRRDEEYTTSGNKAMSRDGRRSRSPKRNGGYDDRRGQQNDRHDELTQQPSRGRSKSPRRDPSPKRGDNGAYNRDGARDDRSRRDERSRMRDDKPINDRDGYSRRESNEYRSRRENDHPPRFGGDGLEHNGNRMGRDQPMSKYGTVGDRARTPSPPRFRREDSSSNRTNDGRGNNDSFRRGDDGQRGRQSNAGYSRYGDENRSRENRDRRSSPPRQQFDDHKNGRWQNERGRSPPKKQSSGYEDRGHSGHRRSRSPSPFVRGGHKKHRSSSPHANDQTGKYHDQRHTRLDADDRRKHGDQDRRSNRYEGKHKDDRARDHRRSREYEKPHDYDRNVERPQRSSSRQSSRDRPIRTPSPAAFDTTGVDDMNPHQQDSPNAAVKEEASSTYEDIDECTVDYEEDDE